MHSGDYLHGSCLCVVLFQAERSLIIDFAQHFFEVYVLNQINLKTCKAIFDKLSLHIACQVVKTATYILKQPPYSTKIYLPEVLGSFSTKCQEQTCGGCRLINLRGSALRF